MVPGIYFRLWVRKNGTKGANDDDDENDADVDVDDGLVVRSSRNPPEQPSHRSV